MKKAWTGVALALGFLFAQGAYGQEPGKVALQIKKQVGQTLAYKNLYRMTFSTDRAAELGASSGGANSLQVEINWEWTQQEGFKIEGKDTVVVATLTKTANSTYINRQTTTIDLYPWSLEDLQGAELSWHVGPQGEVRSFVSVKEPPRLTHATVVSDLRLIAEGDFYPSLPAGPVGVGDSWTAERTATSTYEEFQSFEAKIKASSTFKIKGMKKKGNRNCAEIEETRLIAYKRWLNTGFSSFILEGEGKARGTWLFDVDNGAVVEHQIRMDIEPRPTVVGESSQRNIETRVTIWVDRKLGK